MKQFNSIKSLFIAAILFAAGAVSAQIHPLAFGILPLPGGQMTPNTNYYADYVGIRVEVDSPVAIAGNKNYTIANDGSGAAGSWGGTVTVPIVNVPIFMDSTVDSSGCSAFSPAAAASMAGKIAVIWRGPLTGPCDFGCKALNAQNAGAIAVVLINEYPGQGPVGMGASTTCTGITIPIFMIGNLDGIAISAQYRSGAHVKMTLSTWGQNFNNDLGFVPGGVAGWNDYAIPQSQLVANGNPAEYMGIDGGFIANYGNHKATRVKLAATVTFTPSGSVTPAQIHTDTSGILTTFNVADSIYTFYSPNKYTLAPETSKGQYTMTYNIIQDSIDQFPGDNTTTATFYSTDSVFSKGTYNFNATPPQPARNIYEEFGAAGSEFIWGNMYYVANAGSSLSTVQYSLASALDATTMTGYPLAGPNNIFLFKWVDGYNDVTDSYQFPMDSIVQNGELQLVSLGIKNFDQPSDTSEGLLVCTTMGDSNASPQQVVLEANTHYYLAVDVPPYSSTISQFLGCDGILSPYPRVYGLYNNDGSLEYSSLVVDGNQTGLQGANSLYGNYPCPGAATASVNSVDSFNYGGTKGQIPAVAMTVKPTTVGVKTISKPFADVSLFPNPAKEVLNVSISLPQTEKTITYEIIDGLARFVSKEVHNNVLNETDAISTSKLAPGNYYLIISTGTKIMSRKFTVIK